MTIRSVLLAVALFALSVAPGFAQTSSVPAFNRQLCNKVASVAIASATTTEIVPSLNNAAPVICFAFLPGSGTNPTVQFKYGTKVSSACDTGTTTLSGTAGVSASTPPLGDGAFAIISAPPGNEICLVSGGTPSIQGWVLYGYLVNPYL